jgi:two-component system, sensor histidine kinase SagS
MPGTPAYLLVSLRDITADVLQRQKLTAIYQAGQDLGDLQPQEVLEMSVEERKELLRSKILNYTEALLQYETVEVRLLDDKTGELTPLLAHGMREDAQERQLFAASEGFGVTGFVASTGRSYLCDDTEKDTLYLSGAEGARSSLTVPLVLHDQILGTFNVESARPGAFSDADLQFLELFGREVAMALNTLELLAVEKQHTASESVTRILCDIATPVDEILNDTAWIFEKFVGCDPDVAARLNRILDKTREVRRLVRQSGDADAIGCPAEGAELRGKRILVCDADASVRQAAHELLGRYGALIETAHDGAETLLMARTSSYDALLTDIKPKDMSGSELLTRLREAHEHLPIILMTGYGYDPSHTVVRAKSLGIKTILWKPFRLDQLLREVGKAVTSPVPAA